MRVIKNVITRGCALPTSVYFFYYFRHCFGVEWLLELFEFGLVPKPFGNLLEFAFLVGAFFDTRI